MSGLPGYRISMYGYFRQTNICLWFVSWPCRSFFHFVEYFKTINHFSKDSVLSYYCYYLQGWRWRWEKEHESTLVQMSFERMPHHQVRTIQMILFGVCNEKLTSIRIWPTIRHWNNAPRVMLETINNFILEFACDVTRDRKRKESQKASILTFPWKMHDNDVLPFRVG